MNRRTKIVATLGPASEDRQTIRSLLIAGVNVVRLNFSHGTHEEQASRLRTVRELSEEMEHPVTVLQDLQGPKIRTGKLKDGTVTLKEGESFTLTTEEIQGDEKKVSVDFDELPSVVSPGSRILLDDGNLELVVISVEGREVKTKVELGGTLKERKGVNLPGVRLSMPCVTEKDHDDLVFGLELGVDAVALSFVRSTDDVIILRELIQQYKPDGSVPIIAKLERPEALTNLEDIIRHSDGVMVARGDLGVEMPPEGVPIAQKTIIKEANRQAKVVITATQMLDSMVSNPRPTRAEASDVANAIFDGSDAVMLSGETAVGKYPIQAVEMMHAIIMRAEANLDKYGHWKGALEDAAMDGGDPESPTHDDALSIARAARELAHDRNVAAVAVFTMSGRTAQLMAKARPIVPILAFTPVLSTYRQMPMLWGVIPYLVPYADTLEGMLEEVETAIVTATPYQPGQQVVLISGFPVGARRPPNIALLHTLGGARGAVN